MLALAELQTRIRNTVLGASAYPLKGVIADDRLGYERRLNVYRNNTTILLREALAANFASQKLNPLKQKYLVTLIR